LEAVLAAIEDSKYALAFASGKTLTGAFVVKLFTVVIVSVLQ
jgi:hypothetical protein